MFRASQRRAPDLSAAPSDDVHSEAEARSVAQMPAHQSQDFQPGQFSRVYSSLTWSAARGALESAERGVLQLSQLLQGQQSSIPPGPTWKKGTPRKRPPENIDLIQKLKDE
ncbi:hypothetical protein FRC12_001852 [Ceratobasidium sp. 428]|nr:hypothetical protein FRC09_007309 [Ceratobasidium sp. 395]KAG8774721.1 hypothetical protein FRC12_001852 [Ceratobasidium sp. 428]